MDHRQSCTHPFVATSVRSTDASSGPVYYFGFADCAAVSVATYAA